eukprot:m.256019 g.256019  ORF g.256019 m.256019 type:complete len:53 (-) comp16185_c0_seq21:1473-1631(-)
MRVKSKLSWSQEHDLCSSYKKVTNFLIGNPSLDAAKREVILNDTIVFWPYFL